MFKLSDFNMTRIFSTFVEADETKYLYEFELNTAYVNMLLLSGLLQDPGIYGFEVINDNLSKSLRCLSSSDLPSGVDIDCMSSFPDTLNKLKVKYIIVGKESEVAEFTENLSTSYKHLAKLFNGYVTIARIGPGPIDFTFEGWSVSGKTEFKNFKSIIEKCLQNLQNENIDPTVVVHYMKFYLSNARMKFSDELNPIKITTAVS